MTATTLRRTARIFAIAATALGLALGAGIGPAQAATGSPMPQTREHVLLAVDAMPATSSEICTDWTNEDGSHGTNCPTGGGSIGGPKGSMIITTVL